MLREAEGANMLVYGGREREPIYEEEERTNLNWGNEMHGSGASNWIQLISFAIILSNVISSSMSLLIFPLHGAKEREREWEDMGERERDRYRNILRKDKKNKKIACHDDFISTSLFALLFCSLFLYLFYISFSLYLLSLPLSIYIYSIPSLLNQYRQDFLTRCLPRRAYLFARHQMSVTSILYETLIWFIQEGPVGRI